VDQVSEHWQKSLPEADIVFHELYGHEGHARETLVEIAQQVSAAMVYTSSY
jgi:hypothetical protein